MLLAADGPGLDSAFALYRTCVCVRIDVCRAGILGLKKQLEQRGGGVGG